MAEWGNPFRTASSVRLGFPWNWVWHEVHLQHQHQFQNFHWFYRKTDLKTILQHHHQVWLLNLAQKRLKPMENKKSPKTFRFFNLFSQNHFRPQLGTSQALCCEGPLASPTRSRTPPQPGNHHLHLYLPPVALHFLYRNYSFGVIIITMLWRSQSWWLFGNSTRFKLP